MKRWQELYKMVLMIQVNMMVWTLTQGQTLWSVNSPKVLGRVTRDKTSGSDGIPAELFQNLKDDAVKVLHSICQQIWKT